MNPSVLVGLAVAVPLAAAVVILLAPRRMAIPLSLIAAVASTASVTLLVEGVVDGRAPRPLTAPLAPGAPFALAVDPLGLTFALLASGLWLVTTVYSAGYAPATGLKNRRRYFSAFSASVGAALGVALSANLLTFYLFFEALTLATYPLVMHKQTDEARAASRRYLFYAMGGGFFLLAAVATTWSVTGRLDFVPGGFMHAHGLSTGVLSLLFGLFMLGVLVKAAVMPLHGWLPAAMVAPTPVSALLHAVAVVKAGVFGTLRVVGFVFGPASLAALPAAAVVVGLTLFTILAGSLIALRQDNLKRRLAFSTIVHLAYIVLGAALVTPLAFTGAILHMVSHGLAKITLFFCAGSIYAATGIDRVSGLTGLGRRMPLTFAAFSVASLSLVGIPGLAGFVSKFMLARGAVEAHDYVALAVMLGASLLTAAYLAPILMEAYRPTADSTVAEAPAGMLAGLLTTATLTLAFGIVLPLIGLVAQLATLATDSVFGGSG